LLSYKLTGVFVVDGGKPNAEAAGKHFVSTRNDMSAVYAKAGARLTLRGVTVITSGMSSSHENSSFFGLNAAVLATGKSVISMKGGTISTHGIGANGVFAGDPGTKAELSGVTIHTTGFAAHGVDASNEGTLDLTDVYIETKDNNAAGVATDRGGGTITVTGGYILTHGKASPGLYSTGDISVSGTSILADASETAVIEGERTVSIRDSDLVSGGGWAVMLYESFSGDAVGQRGHFTMAGGSLRSTAGPAFFVTNTTGIIDLNHVDITAKTLVEAKAGRWGATGQNGGHAILTANAQRLTGDLVSDKVSSIEATLEDGSVLTGAVTRGSLAIDASSRWIVTADSTLLGFVDRASLSAKTFTNIDSQGHTVKYDASLPANRWLGGQHYALPGGGSLAPT
jgi:hypothetical protein